MPFKKIDKGKDKGKYKSPSGKVWAPKQVRWYYATQQEEKAMSIKKRVQANLRAVVLAFNISKYQYALTGLIKELEDTGINFGARKLPIRAFKWLDKLGKSFDLSYVVNDEDQGQKSFSVLDVSTDKAPILLLKKIAVSSGSKVYRKAAVPVYWSEKRDFIMFFLDQDGGKSKNTGGTISLICQFGAVAALTIRKFKMGDDMDAMDSEGSMDGSGTVAPVTDSVVEEEV